jgi:hypothetical protein
MTAIYGKLPLQPKIPLIAIVRVMRNDGYKERTCLYLLADRGIPGISTPQLALVEPNLDSGGA